MHVTQSQRRHQQTNTALLYGPGVSRLLLGTRQHMMKQYTSSHADIQGVHQLQRLCCAPWCHLNLNQLCADALNERPHSIALVACSNKSSNKISR